MTERTGAVYEENDIKLSWPIDRVRFVTKTRQDNDVIEWIVMVYLENDIELMWQMRMGVIFDEDKTSDMTNRTSSIYVENDIKLGDRSDLVLTMIKTR